MRKINFKRKNVFVLFLLLLVCIISFAVGGVGGNAYAASSDSTSVKDDLLKDGNFNAWDYPQNDKDYSIQVIQIAESENGYLYLYTYQPCQKSRFLVATDINMSLTDKMGGVVTSELTDEDKPKRYSLTPKSSSGVFCKYEVNGYRVSNSSKRYYNIASIYREYDEYIDTGSTSESILEKKAFEVGKLFIAKSVNGEIKYECQQKETIQIINPFFDYLEYSNGFKFFPDWCRSHYIAFSTDKKIDFLMEADVSYRSTPYGRSVGLGLSGNANPQGNSVLHTNETIDYKMTGENTADGWFSKKYVWDRIENVDDFIKNEDLKDSTVKNLDGKQWVIRFTETEMKLISGQYSTTTFWTEIDNVTILRLKFMTNGIIYNLGAVSDMGHSDDNAGNNNTNEFDFWGWLSRVTGIPTWVWELIIALIPLVILLPILAAFFPIVGQVLMWLIKGVWFIISAPFRFLGWLIRKIKGEV